jgi:hypothetical protein
MNFEVTRNKLTRLHALTLLGAGAIVPQSAFKAPGSSVCSTTNKAREDLCYTSLTEVGKGVDVLDISGT